MSELTPGRLDLALATVLSAEQPARCRVSVDLSRTENSARRAVAFEDCDYAPAIGDLVDAVDLIGQREATAEVVDIDKHERLARIAIDWTTIREATA